MFVFFVDPLPQQISKKDADSEQVKSVSIQPMREINKIFHPSKTRGATLVKHYDFYQVRNRWPKNLCGYIYIYSHIYYVIIAFIYMQIYPMLEREKLWQITLFADSFNKDTTGGAFPRSTLRNSNPLNWVNLQITIS